MKKRLVITTRKSPLALWQAEHVKALLEQAHPNLEVDLLKLVSQGDKVLDAPLNKIGGKGLFVKELEVALLEGRADIAVHSMKDVPMSLPSGLALTGVLKADDPRDAFVSNRYKTLDDLPSGAVLGTSSLRRSSQLKAKYPALEVKWLRGNIHTRMNKLDNGDYDAIILAASGLERMGLDTRIAQKISPEVCLPAVTQGVLGVEGRVDDVEVAALLRPLFNQHTQIRVTAERAMNRRLNGGCQVPIGAYAEHDGQTLWLRGLVGSEDGQQLIASEIKGDVADAEKLGIKLAENLLVQGAGEILKKVGIDVL